MITGWQGGEGSYSGELLVGIKEGGLSLLSQPAQRGSTGSGGCF